MYNKPPFSWAAWRMLPAIIFLSFWEYQARRTESVVFFYGMPSQIVDSIFSDILHAGFIYDIYLTFSTALLGFVLGTLSGLFVSIILSLSRFASYIAAPYVVFLGAIPIVAIAPLMILWFGAGYKASLAVATLSTMMISIGHVLDGLTNALEDWSRLATTFRSSTLRFYRYIVLPGATTWVFSIWRAAIGLSLIGAFVGEFISSDRGLGRYILKASALYDASRVLGGIAVIGGVAIALTYILRLLEDRIMPWRRTR